MHCTNCGTVIADQSKFCPLCGAAQKSPCCPNCAAPLTPGALFCSNCGSELAARQTPLRHPNVQFSQAQHRPISVINETTTACDAADPLFSDRKQWVTLTLCLLFGWTGAHRIYVGKVGTGLLWFFTGGMGLIGWIADLISILAGRFRDKDGAILQ